MSEQITDFLSQPGVVIVIAFLTLTLKGVALWKAALKRQLVWFALVLVFNTLGFLELAYIFFLHRYKIDKGEKILTFLRENIGEKIKTS